MFIGEWEYKDERMRIRIKWENRYEKMTIREMRQKKEEWDEDKKKEEWE